MNQRLERINNIIRDEISSMLRRDLHDPLIGFVTITEVEVSPDLRHAKVFFSVLGDADQVRNSIKGLLRARKFINSRLAERVELRYIPRLRFVLDDTAAKAQRMAQLLTAEQDQLAEALARHEAEDRAAAEAAALAPGTPPPDELDELDDEEDLDDEDVDSDEDLDEEDEDFDEDDGDEADEEDEDFDEDDGDVEEEDEDFDDEDEGEPSR